MKKTIKRRKVKMLYWDWKEIQWDAFQEVKRVFKSFGLYAYDAPSCDHSDQWGMIVSNVKLSVKQQKEEEGFEE